jgi:xylitol oxidase
MRTLGSEGDGAAMTAVVREIFPGRETNWAGNYTYRADRLHRPSSVEEVQDLVAGAPRVRVLGSRHSFNDMADSLELLTLDALPADVIVHDDARTVSFGAGLKYGKLAEVLSAEGLALHALASLPHISVAGAVATATHGSGDEAGNLATAVAGVEIVTSSGEVLVASRGDADFNGLVVGLGALGAVTRISLDVEPSYDVRQRVFEGLDWETLFENFDEITLSGDSVSVFTRWGERIEQVWVKSRVEDAAEQVRGDLSGAIAATIDRHPILGLDPAPCTPQLGVPGPWWDRWPHFRMGFTPSSGEEIQSEYFVARQHAIPAIHALRDLGEAIGPVLQMSEIRTVAADELWMSPQYGQDTVGVHFTWRREQEAVERVLVAVEAALAPFEPRPHWGKLFLADATSIAALYERLPDFTSLLERLDPRGAFRNPWLSARVLGDT